MASGLVGENDHRSSANTASGDFMKQMSKSFALVVRLDENNKEVIAADRDSLVSHGPIGGNVVKPDDGQAVTASSTQTS